MMVINGEEGSKCEVHIGGIRLEHVFEFKYLGMCFGRIMYRCGRVYRKLVRGRRVAGVIRSLANARYL